MGWKVNLQPKLIAESLKNEAWTIGLKEDEIHGNGDKVSSSHVAILFVWPTNAFPQALIILRTVVICSP